MINLSWLLLLLTLYSPLSITAHQSKYAKQVFETVRNADLEKLKHICTDNADTLRQFINVPQIGSKQTPLMHAILSGHTKIVAYLLSLQEVDHTVPEKDGYTPMHAAGFQGRAEIVNLLLHSHRGISPSDRHYDGYTPMHRACWGRETRHFETVMAFIEQAGVPFDEKADDGRTCLDMTQNEQTREYLKKFKTKAREEAEKAKAEKIRREKELRSDL